MLAKPCFPTVYVATLTKFTSLYKLAHLSYLRKRASTDRTRTCIGGRKGRRRKKLHFDRVRQFAKKEENFHYPRHKFVSPRPSDLKGKEEEKKKNLNSETSALCLLSPFSLEDSI